jgi:hypothetical protein
MNYTQIEVDFIERTLELIDQYETYRADLPPDKQYNHTLLINCLVGLIILPKEKTYSRIPKEKLHFEQTLAGCGIKKSKFNDTLRDTKELFHRLRNAVAHFGIEVISVTRENQIDIIRFTDVEAGMFVADFHSDEIFPFLKYYANTIIDNIKNYPA